MQLKKKYLEYLGLSDKEAMVYIELLRSDVMSGAKLAQATGIKKATIYLIIQSLVRKGIVKEVKVGKRVHYHAEPPEKFRQDYEDRQKLLERQLDTVNEIVMELNSIDRREGARPIIKHYEGDEAVKNEIQEHVSQKGFSPDIDYGIYSYDLMEKFFKKKDIDEIDLKRIQENVKFRAVYSGKTKHIEVNNKEQELMKVNQDEFPILCNISIYKDEVRFHTLGKKLFGVLIKNQEIATTLQSLIDYSFALRESK